jgi:S1-C subfamily serine protease
MYRTLRSLTLLSSLLLGAGCALGRPSLPPTKAEVVQQVLPSVVELVYEQDQVAVRYASGVVVGAEPAGAGGRPASWVLTSAHAVGGPSVARAALVIRHHDPAGAVHRATGVVEGTDDANDLALVRVEGVHLPAARIGDATGVRLADEVVVIGAPFGRGLSVSSGIVSQLVTRQPDGRATREPLVKVDAPVGYGSSGGGVFQVRTGRLLGVVEGYRTATVSLKLAGAPYSFQVPMPGETFVVHAAEIRRFLSDRGYSRLLTAP